MTVLGLLMAGQMFGAVPATGDCPECLDVPPDTAVEDTLEAAASVEQEELEPEVEIGGAIRYNFHYKDWQRSRIRRTGGEFEFDTFWLDADGSFGDLFFSTQYRFYAGVSFIHHAYVGYAFDDDTEVHLGVNKVPFGTLPYASHNWFFLIPYYVGLEDDYDAGIKLQYTPGPWDVRAAFYKNDEGNYTGNTIGSARYSYDVVPVLASELGLEDRIFDRFDRETNQFNGRLAYGFDHGDFGATEVGVSGMRGGLFNTRTSERGHHWAAGVHIDADWDRFDVKLEALRYEKRPDLPPSRDERFVTMGAYDAPYKVASRSDLYVAAVAYDIPADIGPISNIRVYNDYSAMPKDIDGFPTSHMNVLGSLITAGPVLVFVDIASGKHHAWLGPNYVRAFAEGGPDDDEWHTRLNVNVGYYF